MAEITITLREKGKMSRNEDWYRLVFDQNTGELFVEHEWHYSGSGGGTNRWPINNVPENMEWLQDRAIAEISSRLGQLQAAPQ
jgi:hypothetical protein